MLQMYKMRATDLDSCSQNQFLFCARGQQCGIPKVRGDFNYIMDPYLFDARPSGKVEFRGLN
jgi:hypothetical protein